MGQTTSKIWKKKQITALKYSRGNFDKPMSISHRGKQDLLWWENNIQTAICTIKTKNPDFILTADASMIGWGAFMGERKVQCEWDQTLVDVHINVKELLAVYLGLQYLAYDKSSCVIQIISDNSTTVAHINHMGGVRSDECRDIAFKIWHVVNLERYGCMLYTYRE